jgi:predicted ATP-dependent protease
MVGAFGERPLRGFTRQEACMATGWRGWGRRDATEAGAAQRPGADPARPRQTASPGAFTAVDDLIRRAAWGQLAGSERTTLLAPYAALAAPLPASPGTTGTSAAAPLDRLEDPATQAWVCDLVAAHLQAPAASVIRTWLADGAPTAHLYAYSMVNPGRGRTSTVATLARRAMALRPAPPDYCYVPDPDIPSHSWVLALPTGTGSAFVESLGNALRQIVGSWEKPRERARRDGDDADDDLDDAALRTRLITRGLEAIQDGIPDVARPYLARLGAALTALTRVTTTPQIADPDDPAGRVLVPAVQVASAAAGENPATTGGVASATPHAPVIVASLARMRLNEALLRANGGILILLAADFVDRDQLTSEWAPLRAVLQSGALPLRGHGEPAIPITTRVALIGSYAPVRVLERAEGFSRLFRYKARFEDDTAWTPDAEAVYAAFSDGVARHYAIPPFDAAGIARLVEEGARRSVRQHRARLTTDLLVLRDLALEAGRQAQTQAKASATPTPAPAPSTSDPSTSDPSAPEPSAPEPSAPEPSAPSTTLAGIVTTAADVEAAIARRRTEHGAFARDSREAVLAGRAIVPTDGATVGQINGLIVATFTPFESRYGAPIRISAAVSPGRERLVDIEREAATADSAHVGAALTMAGYLTWRYGRQRPTSVVARLRFEQEHEWSAGPSASAAELFALLSALANVPIRRALAVTGTVGLQGEIQPIGGANEKIEGFWEICRARREQGERPEGGVYGVLIPAANAQDLMLRAEVAASIAGDGWFRIWPLRDVDDGLPILTGLSARELHARVARQLQRYNEIALRDLPR